LLLWTLIDKWKAFNWHTQEVDAHDVRQILLAIEAAQSVKDKPSVIIAHSIKGKGVSFMENQVDWHGRAPDDKQLSQALSEVDNR